MVAEIVISANFSDSSSRILAGTNEDSLQETSLVVADVLSRPINAVKALAELPSLDELRARLIGLLQAPATKIARVLKEPGAKLARVLQAQSAKGA